MKNNHVYRFLLIISIFMDLLILLSPILGKAFILFPIIIFSILLIFNDAMDMFIVLFAFFPFANIFKLSSDSMSLLTLCEILCTIKIIITMLFSKKELKLNKSFSIVFLTLIVYLLVRSIDVDSLTIAFKLGFRIFLIYYYFNNTFDRTKKINVYKYSCYAIGLGLLIMMFISQNDNYMIKVSAYLRTVYYGNGTNLMRNCGLLTDPNYCSMAIVISISSLTVLYANNIVKNEFFVVTIPLIILGFTTYSKSYFLCIFAYVLFLLLFMLFRKKIIICLIFACAIILVIKFTAEGKIDLFNRVFVRFKNGDLTTGRTELFITYLKYFLYNPTVFSFGAGLSRNNIIGYNNVHNIYVEIVFRVGIVGFLLFLLCLVFSFNRKLNARPINFLPLIFTIVMYSMLPGLMSFELMYYIILSFVPVFSIWNTNCHFRQ